MAAARYVAQPLPSASAYQFSNPANAFRATFTPSETRVASSGGGHDRELVIKLIGCGYGSSLQTAPDGTLGANQNRVENRRGGLVEWFVNTAEGIEHGFDLAAPPSISRAGSRAGDEALRVRMEIGGDWRPRLDAARQTVTFIGASGDAALTYNKLRVYDARKREAPAHFEIEGNRLAIVVDDRAAEYPLTIDPLIAQQAMLTANDGAGGDTFGSSVAIYADTAVISAPGDRNSDNENQGSVYVFSRVGSTWRGSLNLAVGGGFPFNDSFRDAVAIYENTIVIGAISRGSDKRGSVYIFVNTNARWILQSKITANDSAADASFGSSVAIYGDTIVVGASEDDIAGNINQGSAYVFTRAGSTWSQQQKLTANDGAASDNFGSAVAIHADTVVVGAGPGNSNQGSAYVFMRAGSTWSLQQKLIANDGPATPAFGSAVAIYADTVVVGDATADIGGRRDQGAAYVFVRAGSTWSLQQKLTANDGQTREFLGASVAIYADTVVAGATAGGSTLGAAYVFTRAGSTWNQRQKLTAIEHERFGASSAIYAGTIVVGSPLATVNLNSGQGAAYVFVVCDDLAQQKKLTATDGAAFDFFGHAIAIYANTVVVGAPFDNLGQGSAYVFAGSGTFWSLEQKLTADDGAVDDFFGFSVAIYEGTIVIGAFDDDVGGNTGQGSAYVFVQSGPWIQQQKLTADDGAALDAFGRSVAIYEDTVVVGAQDEVPGGNIGRGSAYVFVRSGSTWSQQQKLTDGDSGEDFFGVSVAIYEGIVVVGDSLDGIDGSINQGSAYAFTRDGSTWNLWRKLMANDGAADDLFGDSVAIYRNTIVVGAPGDDIGGNNDQGSAYVFVGDNLQQKLTANDGSTGDRFGDSVAIYANAIAIGTPADDVGGNRDQGSAYIFARPVLTWSQQQKLTASDGAANDSFGFSVAIHRDSAVAGAVDDDIGANSNQGSAYVFACSGCSTITLGPEALPNGVAGRAYNQTITAGGGAEPISFSLSSGSLPPGLALSQTGQISGVPAAAGARNITITAADANGCVGARDYTLTVLPNLVTTVSAASYAPALAPKEIVTGFGLSLANSTIAASLLPLPTALAGTSVIVKDSNGVERAAPLFFVSPTQINYQIPNGAAPGPATVTVFIGAETVATGVAQITATAPAIFTLNQSGSGPAAAIDALTGAAAPFNAMQANGQPNIISVYGTGLGADATDVDGNVSTSVQVFIDGNPITALYAGRAPGFVGANQFNIALPAGITSGAHTLTIARGGAMSNTVTITIK